MAVFGTVLFSVLGGIFLISTVFWLWAAAQSEPDREDGLYIFRVAALVSALVAALALWAAWEVAQLPI